MQVALLTLGALATLGSVAWAQIVPVGLDGVRLPAPPNPFSQEWATGAGAAPLSPGPLFGAGERTPSPIVGDELRTAGSGAEPFTSYRATSGGVPSFTQPYLFAYTGVRPYFVASGDLNGDGHLDLVTASTITNTVSVLLGHGNGTFETKIDFATGQRPFAVAIGDLNGDGHPDLATANLDSNTISVLLGQGDGTFETKTDFATGLSPSAVAIGDLNGDGHPDLATANQVSNTVSALLGQGDGTFGTKTDFATGLIPQAVAIGDLNGDGHLDLATTNLGSNTISVLLGQGDGTFGTKTDFATGLVPQAVAIGDLNGDGHPDLATANKDSNTISVLLGQGDGTFGTKTDFATGLVPQAVAIGDLNGDSHPDLATANSRLGTVSVLLGQGDGTFGTKTDFATGAGPVSLAIGDLNGDGNPDLATANDGSITVSVLLGQGNGNFGAKTDFPTGVYPHSLAIGDLNGDGHPDLATANLGSNTISVLLGQGDGTFGTKTDFATGLSPSAVAIGDLNGDGHPDLATANRVSNTVSVLLGQGDGTFGTKTDFATGAGPVSLAIGDLNRDGHPDLATANAQSSTVSVLLGQGNGNFVAKTDFPTGAYPRSLAIGDLNGDGHPDLATAGGLLGAVSVLLGQGNGVFGAKTDFATGFSPLSLAIGDLNGDGHPDLATANPDSSTVSVLLGQGNGTFEAKTDFTTGVAPQSLVIGDLDANGHLDMATANYGSSTVSVLLGAGDGTFGANTDFATGSYPVSVAIGDPNVDGRLDLATANYGANSVTVLLNNSTLTYAITASAGAHGAISPVGVSNVTPGGSLAYTITPDAGYAVADVLVDGLTVGAVTSYTFTNVHAAHTIAASFSPNFQFVQQGPKLVGTGAIGSARQGLAVAVSADGNTAIVGGFEDNGGVPGAAWIWTRSGSTWSQAAKLVGSGSSTQSHQGYAVALSADGMTAIVGAIGDGGTGAAWIWVRSGNIWYQQGTKLTAGDAQGPGNPAFGASVSLSSDGNTALIGGPNDDSGVGAAWVWTRTGETWIQLGSKLVGTGATGAAQQGYYVAISSDGNTAIVGGPADAGFMGATWVWVRNGAIWTQQGSKLVGAGAIGPAHQGSSVAISSNGARAAIGGLFDNTGQGATWIWQRSNGSWTQVGTKLVSSTAIGQAHQGRSVSLSSDGNTLLAGGDYDDNLQGAAWVWKFSGGSWTQSQKLFGSGGSGNPNQGVATALSGDGTTAIVGGDHDDDLQGAAWVFVAQPPGYAITATAGAHGAIAPAGVSTVAPGASLAYTITPDSCYAISDVLVDSVSVGAVTAYSFTDVQAAHSISATFAPISYTITSSAGAGGSISPVGTVSVACGADQAFTITPANGFAILGVLVDGVAVAPLSPYTFSHVGANHTIAASFISTAAVVSAGNASGTICPSNTCVSVPVTITRIDSSAAEGYSVSFQLSPGLTLCSAPGSVTEGTFLSNSGNTSFQVVNKGNGLYTVDAALLGDCGPVAHTGTLFTLQLSSTLPSGPGTVTIGALKLRNCANAPLAVHAGTTGSVPIDNQPPVVAVTSPAGGETWSVGAPHDITWTATDNAGVASVDLSYSTDGGASYPHVIATGLPNSGTYAWTVTGPATGNARVRVTAHDTNCSSDSAASAADFTILPPVPTVSAISPGITIGPAHPCVTVPVTLARPDSTMIEAVSVTFQLSPGLTLCSGTAGITEGTFLSNAGNTTFQVIDHGGGSYTADVALLGGCGPTTKTGTLFSIPVTSLLASGPATVTIGALKLRNCANAPLTVLAGSSATIAIDRQLPAVTVTSPAGGESWSSGDSRNITWTATDNSGVATVDLAYSTNGGATYPFVIATGIANTGSYAWTIPSARSTQARVRVTAHDIHGNLGSGSSAANFTLVGTVGVGPLAATTDLLPVIPNPMRGSAQLQYSLAREAQVELAIYSVDGRRVRTLVRGPQDAGVYGQRWDGTDDSGAALRSGIYFVRLRTQGLQRTRFINLVR